MLKCKLVQCQQQKNKQLFKNWGQKVEANALLKEYLAAQQGLSVYLNDIERIIFKPLQELNS